MAKKNMLLLAALALTGFGGSFYGGTLISARLMEQDETAAPTEPTGTVEIEAGRFALHLPGRDIPVIVDMKVIAPDAGAPGPEELRDRLQAILANVLDMPIVTNGGTSMDRIREAVLVVAAQEAPWVKGIEMTLLSQVPDPF